MAKFYFFAAVVLFSVLHHAVAADPLRIPPSQAPAPELAADATPTTSPSPSPANAPRASISSPPSPPPSESAPAPSPSASASPPSPPSPTTPSPAPSRPSDINHSDNMVTAKTEGSGSSSGMSAGKKLGITVAAIVGAGVVAAAGLIYKKRQDNIRRSQYSFAARREIL